MTLARSKAKRIKVIFSISGESHQWYRSVGIVDDVLVGSNGGEVIVEFVGTMEGKYGGSPIGNGKSTACG